MEKYKILKELVKFNTIKDKENKEILNYIEDYLQSLGFKTEYKTKALVMSIGENPKLGFLGHTDTVEYTEEFKNPFELTLKDEYLYGLGACDMKGGISAMLDAVKKIDFLKLNYGMKLHFTYDDEITFGGINELVKNKEIFPEYMIFGEPTNTELLSCHKGLLEYEINFIGKKAHSSNPDKGISANMNGVKFINELDTYYQTNIKIEKEPAFEIPYTTMNIGIINGGSANNSVSAHCKISIDFRIAKANHINKLYKKIEELCKKYNSTYNIIELCEPFVDQIDFLPETKTANFLTEACKINGSKRIILGTGPITAHEVNEHIATESYDKLVEQYKKLILRFN